MWSIEQIGPVRVARHTATLPDCEPGQIWTRLEALLLAEVRQRWVIDVGSQRLLTSEALAVMVGIVRQVQAAGGRIAFANCSLGVVNILTSMHLSKMVHLHPDVPTAVADLSA
jgi:hypothetical protein